MKKNQKLIVLIIGILVIGGAIALSGSQSSWNGAGPNIARGAVTVYKSPNCGCCENYITYMRRAGFEVERIEHPNIEEIKEEYGIPYDVESCHTMVMDARPPARQGYVIEGHMPIEAIEYMHEQNPDIRGIALPGMPSGSPGMPGAMTSPFMIRAILDDGSTEPFMEL